MSKEKGAKPFPLRLEQHQDLTKNITALLAGKYKIDKHVTGDKLNEMGAQLLTGFQLDLMRQLAIREDAYRMNEILKPELNAITAILITELWNEPAFAQMLEKHRSTPGTLTDRFEGFEKDVRAYIADFIIHPRTSEPAVFADIRDRYAEIMRFRAISLDPKTNEQQHIMSGVGTAIKAAGNLAIIVLNHAIGLHKRGVIDLSREQLISIIQRSYRNIGMMLANMDQNVGGQLMLELWKDPSLFELRNVNGEYALFLLPDRLPQLKTAKGTPILEAQRFGKITRCPAMYPAHGHPAVIPEFFKYALDLVKDAKEFPKT